MHRSGRGNFEIRSFATVICRWAVLLAICLCSGCGSPAPLPAPGEDVSLDKVPPALLQAAREKLPGAKFDQAWKFQHNGEETFGIRGRTSDGAVHAVRVQASGKVLDVQ